MLTLEIWITERKPLQSMGFSGWMSVEQWWKITDRGKLKYKEKYIIEFGLYVDVWVQSNGVMLLSGETEALGEKCYKAWVVGGWVGVQFRLNGSDRVNLKCWEKTKYRMDGS